MPYRSIMYQEFKPLTHGNKQVFVCLFGVEGAEGEVCYKEVSKCLGQ